MYTADKCQHLKENVSMFGRSQRVYPAEKAGSLDNRIRRWVQDPRKILRPYALEGMTVIDIGCGSGFFTTALAEFVGKFGNVIAADFQEEMLKKLKYKIQGTELEKKIILHKTGQHRIGFSGQVDLALAFYMVHEVPDQQAFLKEIKSILKPSGHLLIVEPKFHVSAHEFEETVTNTRAIGFELLDQPKIFFSRAAFFGLI
jgi:ubiquinone/menaquinone biosynthesis C-methylase UbiE